VPALYPTKRLSITARQSKQSSFAVIFIVMRAAPGFQRELNANEQWNGATDFVSFACRGEFVSNVQEGHEVSMLALHLLQNYTVYMGSAHETEKIVS